MAASRPTRCYDRDMWRASAVFVLVLVAGCYDLHLRDGAAGGPDARDGGRAGFDASADRWDAGRSAPRDGGVVERDAGDALRLDAGADAPAGEHAYLWCLEMTPLFCRGNQRCCPDEDRVPFASADECTDTLLPFCDNWRRGAFLDGRIHWDGDGARRQLEVMMEALASCEDFGFEPTPKWFRGTLSEGADCTPPELLAHGELADGTRISCRPDLYCRVTGTEDDYRGTCRPRAGEGEACFNPWLDCRDEYYCEYGATPEGSPPTEGGCAPKRPEGAACESSFQCVHGACTDGICTERGPAHGWCFTRN